jgi:hypothetical protein
MSPRPQVTAPPSPIWSVTVIRTITVVITVGWRLVVPDRRAAVCRGRVIRGGRHAVCRRRVVSGRWAAVRRRRVGPRRCPAVCRRRKTGWSGITSRSCGMTFRGGPRCYGCRCNRWRRWRGLSRRRWCTLGWRQRGALGKRQWRALGRRRWRALRIRWWRQGPLRRGSSQRDGHRGS